MLTTDMVCNRCPALWWSLAAWALGGRAEDGSAAGSAWKPPAKEPLSVPESMESLLSNLVTESIPAMREERAQADKAMQEDHAQANKDVETVPMADSDKAVISAGEADASAQAEEDASAQAEEDASAQAEEDASAQAEEDASAQAREDAEAAASADSGKEPVIRAGADVSGPDSNLESDALAEAGRFLEGSDVAGGSADAV